MSSENVQQIVDEIRRHHRRRRFAMKIQQKLDRALESYIRVNATDWDPNADEDEREKVNQKVKEMIKSIRDGKEMSDFAAEVLTSDKARAPADEMRQVSEKHMERLAKELPVYPWVESLRGAGALGLATIVAEAGSLDRYANPEKLWSRLGYAPFDGHAGSTWKRQTWRPRALSAEEWTEHPFSGERYALMHQIANWLVNAQWIGAKKTGTAEGRPNGVYGEVYANRRKRTAITHPDWTKGHSRMDGLRVAMKAFLNDLWCHWNGKPITRSNQSGAVQSSSHASVDTHVTDAGGNGASSRNIRDPHTSDAAHVTNGASGQGQSDTRIKRAARAKPKRTTRQSMYEPSSDF